MQDLYTRTYLNANNTWFKTAKGEHIVKAGVRFERLGNDVTSGNQQPTVTLNWNQARTTLDGRVVRGKYGYYTISRSYTGGTVASNNWSFWAQDSWTVRSRLTINYGGLASSDEPNATTGVGRTSPNVDRYFDALYMHTVARLVQRAGPVE